MPTKTINDLTNTPNILDGDELAFWNLVNSRTDKISYLDLKADLLGTASDTEILFMDGTNIAGDSRITYNNVTNVFSLLGNMVGATVDDFTNTVHADGVHKQIRNESGGELVKGDLVHASGFSIGQDLVLVKKADASSTATMPVMGVITETIANNASGGALESGRISGVDTSSFSVGDILFATTTPGVFGTRPTNSTDIVQSIGVVLRSHATLGEIEVEGAGSINTPPNLLDAAMWIGDATNFPVPRIISGDITISNSGVANVSAGTFISGQLQLNNPADTFQYIFTGSAIAANRAVTLPLLAAPDIFVMEAFATTLTNKTFDSTSNVWRTSGTTTLTAAVTITNGDLIFTPAAYVAASGNERTFDITADVTGQTGTSTFAVLYMNILDTARASSGVVNAIQMQNDGVDIFAVSSIGRVNLQADLDLNQNDIVDVDRVSFNRIQLRDSNLTSDWNLESTSPDIWLLSHGNSAATATWNIDEFRVNIQDNGTAASPTLTIGQDVDGFFRSAVNELSISLNNIQEYIFGITTFTVNANIANIGFLQLDEIADPGTPAVNTSFLYMDSTDEGLYYENNAGPRVRLDVVGGDVFKVGTPADNQIGVWTGDGTIEGDSLFSWSNILTTHTILNKTGTDAVSFINAGSGTGQDAVSNMRISGSNTGDPYSIWTIFATRSYALGIDNTDSDILKLRTNASSTATPSSGTTLMSITAAGEFSFLGTVDITADGTAAIPALRIGTEDDGFYRSAVNQISLSINNIQVAQYSAEASSIPVRFDANKTGNSVIVFDNRNATGNAVIKLETSGNVNGDSYILFEDTVNNGSIGFDGGNDELVLAFGPTLATPEIRIASDQIAFFDTFPVSQPSHIVDADGTLADITTKFNTFLAQFASLGLQASS